jgi:ribosomal protein L2
MVKKEEKIESTPTKKEEFLITQKVKTIIYEPNHNEIINLDNYTNPE